MTTNIVSRIIEQEYKAYQVVDANLADIVALLTRAKNSKRWDHEPRQIELDDGSLGWRIILKPQPDGSATYLVAHPTYWIVECDNLELAVYTGPEAVALFHDDVPMRWSGTTTAPTVTANEDGTAEITVRQPVSINGPWTYTVALTDVTTDTTTEPTPQPTLTIVQSPGPLTAGLVLGADVTMAFTVTPGHQYTATVTVECVDYEHTAQSLPVEFTAPEPEPEDDQPPE